VARRPARQAAVLAEAHWSMAGVEPRGQARRRRMEEGWAHRYPTGEEIEKDRMGKQGEERASIRAAEGCIMVPE
jgi:hypothetical protein